VISIPRRRAVGAPSLKMKYQNLTVGMEWSIHLIEPISAYLSDTGAQCALVAIRPNASAVELHCQRQRPIC
jgi:hypothetical protein